MSLRLSAQSLLLTPLAAAACILTTGCANMVTTATSVSATPTAQITGNLHGGNQPVTNSDIRLYAAGTTGYGSSPTLYAVTTSDNNGNFGFSQTAGAGPTSTKVYGCPINGTDPQMYITAKGGATQGTGNGTNSSAVFIIALGKCSTIASAFVDMNEVTTVATMAALQQYFAPGNATADNLNHLGSPNTGQALAGFANGVAAIPNLAVVATGAISPGTTVTATPAGSTTAATVTITPEAAKIGTLANIVASCINTVTPTTGNCATLFTNATPPSSSVTSQPALSFGPATDTLQALYYMLVNPTSGSAANLTALFNLQSAQAVFQPMLATSPTDWTVGIKYSSSSACTSGTFLGNAYHIAPDAAGNIWMAGGSANGNLMEIGPTGTPLTCALGTLVASSKSVVFDINGNAWIASGTTANVYKYVPSTGAYTTWPTLAVPFVLAADASGNVYYSYVTGTGVAKFTGAASATTPTASTQIATVGTLPNFMAIDTAGNIYTTNSTTSAGAVYTSYASTATGNTGGYLTTSTAAGVCNPYGISIGIANAATISNSNYTGCPNGSPNSSANLTFSATSAAYTAGAASPTYAAGIIAPRENAIDGAGNIWAPNSTAASTNYTTSAASTSYAVSEFSAVGTALSPTGNTTTASVSGGFQKDSTIFPLGLRSVAIDPTGNVWVGLNTGTASATAVVVSEIVGAAVPVITPIASALAAGATTTNAVSKP